MKMEKIHHERNGQILMDTKEYHIFQKLFQKGYAHEICSWEEDVNEFGHFKCVEYLLSSSGKYIVKEWRPNFGYSWQETIVYRATE